MRTHTQVREFDNYRAGMNFILTLRGIYGSRVKATLRSDAAHVYVICTVPFKTRDSIPDRGKLVKESSA